MFQNFPYTDMHQLNLDWIIKIAKDFLDQYTHIQQLIADGEESLQTLTDEGLQQLQQKADDLEALLNSWYETHSQDIADQLADALEDLNEWYTIHSQDIAAALTTAVNNFNSAADAKTAQSIASIPDDYTELANTVTGIKNGLKAEQFYDYINGGRNYYNNTWGGVTYEWEADYSLLHISGTPTQATFHYISIYEPFANLVKLTPGEKYYLNFYNNKYSNIEVEVWSWSDSTTGSRIVNSSEECTAFVVPAGSQGITVRVAVNGLSAIDEYVNVFITREPTIYQNIKEVILGLKAESMYDYCTYYREYHNNLNFGGIAYEWNNDKSLCHIYGTPTRQTFHSITYDQTTQNLLPLTPGETYYLSIIGLNLNNTQAEVFSFSSYQEGASICKTSDVGQFTVPVNSIGILVRFLTDGLDPIDEYANIYITKLNPKNLNTVTPVSTDLDMTPYIESALKQYKHCQLSAGTYYVSGIDMPDNSELCGVGYNTKLILKGSSTDAYVIKTGSNAHISNLFITGSETDIIATVLDTQTLRDGIRIVGTFDPSLPDTQPTIRNTIIENVYLKNFTGTGLKLHDNGGNPWDGVAVSNCFIERCSIGLRTWWYEYSTFTNIHVNRCYYGCRNDGGNNTFNSCNFSNNTIGFYMDNTNDEAPNIAHGSLTGCTINHSGNNNGIAIKIVNVPYGFIFSACHILYGSIQVQGSEGIIFDGCSLGGANGQAINITSGKLVMFTGCQWSTNPTITRNAFTHLVNCYNLHTGDAIQ